MNILRAVASADGFRVVQDFSGSFFLEHAGQFMEARSAYEAVCKVPQPSREKLLTQWKADCEKVERANRRGSDEILHE